MRIPLLIGWLLVPLLAGAYHYGPGQDKLRLEAASAILASAESHAVGQQWQAAVDDYDRALSLLPVDRLGDTRRVRLERAKARIFIGQLPEAAAELKDLVDELQADNAIDSGLMTDARSAYANSQYYMTWLMRLEGLARDDWEPEIEGSRQTFRSLAEEAEKAGDPISSRDRKEDLESAIRLARMEPGELQGLPIPKPCRGCKSGQCKKPGRKPGQSRNQAKDARGASSGPPPDDAGS